MAAAREPPHLLHFRVSHYNEKVRWALDHKAWPHTREALVPGFHIPRVRFLTGQNRVPVLVVDGEAIFDSSHILEAIERLRPDPPLFPRDAADRARALELEEHYDEVVAPDLRCLFWASYLDRPADAARVATDGFSAALRPLWRAGLPFMKPIFRANLGLDPENVRRTRARLRGHFDRLASDIGPSGFLVGTSFGLADLSAAAIMSAVVRPPQFPYPLPEPLAPDLVEQRASLADHAAFRWVERIYAEHRGTSSEIR